ncbi:MAG: glutamine amidotransferase, partial [Gammaproteobacteria bacterium]
VLGMSRSTPLGAVILISDGADNSGAITQEQLAELAAYNVPIHTVAVGRQRIEEDLELQDVTLPTQALPGTIMSARVAIRHDKAGLARLKVYDGDKIVMSSEIELQADTDISTAWLDIPALDTGYRHLKFALEPWPGEQVLENNDQSRVVEVKEDRYRVLYIEGEPRWEYKFIRRALEKDPSVDLVSLLRVSQNKFYRQGISSAEELEQGLPESKVDLFKYDAMIIGSIEAASFNPEQQKMIHDFVSERGGSLLMLAGPNGLGLGGWGNSLLQEALPAKLDTEDSEFIREKVKVEPTTAGLQSAMLKLDQEIIKNRLLWNELPEIADYQHIGPLKLATSVLLNISLNGEKEPLLVSQPYGRGASYILATGGTWRWQMSLPLEDQRHETFWRQLMRELVINSPGRFHISSQVVADRIKINTELRDENYEPEQELKLTAVVTPEIGEAMTIELQPSTEIPGVMTGEFIAEQSGLYNIETITRRNDEPIDSARLAIYHNAGKAEYFSLRTNRSLLSQLADATGGKDWNVEDLDELVNAVEFSSAGITEQEIRPLWDAPIIFLILMLLKSLEWILRRQWRTI